MERNTLKSGRVRFIVFHEEDTWYGVALEFGIVISEKSAEAVWSSLREASRGYLESLRKANLRATTANPLLNQDPDSEYEDLWNKIQAKEAIPSPIKVDSSGFINV